MNISQGELQAWSAGPRKLALSWKVSGIPEKIIQNYFQRNMKELASTMRIYDVTSINFNRKNAHHVYEIPVPYENGFWFITGLTKNRSYIAELGVFLSETEFFPLLQSNPIQTTDGIASERMVQPLDGQDACSPKWLNHVSTYSYYPGSVGEDND